MRYKEKLHISNLHNIQDQQKIDSWINEKCQVIKEIHNKFTPTIKILINKGNKLK